MSWLRIDDGFDRHPKVTALSFRRRWLWMGVLCYCARYGTEGRLPENIKEHVSGISQTVLDEMEQLGLLDHDHEGYVVHDWQQYRPKDPTAAERQANWRKRKRVDGSVTEKVTAKTSTSRARVQSSPVQSRPKTSSSSNGYLLPEVEMEKLLIHLKDKDDGTEGVIRAIAKERRLPAAAFGYALDCAQGPGVKSPTRVAVSELRKWGLREVS